MIYVVDNNSFRYWKCVIWVIYVGKLIFYISNGINNNINLFVWDCILDLNF